MLKTINVLVTGATGFVGSHLCKSLMESGLMVYGTYLNGKPVRKHKNFKAVKLDITDEESVMKSVKNIKPVAIFHTAAYLPNPNTTAESFFSNNVKGTFNLLEACRVSNVSTFIQSSSMSVYGTDISYLPVDEKHPLNTYDFYSLSKKLSDDLCLFYAKNHNLNAVVLRYSGVFGPGKESGAVYSFFKNALVEKPLTIGTNINWDIVDVEDVVRANFISFKKADKLRGQMINIGSGKEINILDLAKKIIKLTKSKSKIEIATLFKKKPYRFYYNIGKARRLLGFKPGNLDASLKNYMKFLQK